MRGGALSLPMLFERFGRNFTAQELMYYYTNSTKLVKTRPHPQGSRLVRDAAQARFKAHGRYGHRD